MRFSLNGFAAVLIFVACCVAIIPFWPSFPTTDLDSAWKFALNAAVAQHEVFGRDIIFTFGPYASVFTGSYHPATDGLAMIGSGIVATALAAGLIVTTRGWWRGMALLLAIALSWLPIRDPVFFLLPMVFLAVAAQGRRSAAALVLLALAMAIAVLVKATFAAAALVGLAGGCMLLLLRRDFVTVSVIAIIFPITVCVAWVIAQQPLGAMPDFFVGEREITAGYADAMSLPGPAWPVVAFLANAALLLALNTRSFVRAGWPGAILAGGSIALLFLAFKAGCIRQDVHVAIAVGTLGLVAFVLALLHRGLMPALGLVAALLCAVLVDAGIGQAGPVAEMQRVAGRYADAWHGVLDRARHGTDLRAAHEAAMTALRASDPLPKLSGTADIYSVGQSRLLASGAAWSPRPVLQSYSAYTPALAEADARHLEGPSAPENVFMRVEPIDDHLPSMEDGPSWLPLLSRYTVTAMLGETALLRKIPDAPNATLLGPRGSATPRQLNAAVAAPQDGKPHWAWVDVRPTILGRVASLIFKSPPLYITIRLKNGGAPTYRFIPGMARAGFMLTPLIIDSAQLFASEVPGSHDLADRVPVSFTIHGDPSYWQKTYSFTIVPMTLPMHEESLNRIFLPPTPATPADDRHAPCYLDAIDGNIVVHSQVFQAGGLTRLTGWALGGNAMGIAPQSVALTLQAPDGSVSSFPASLRDRPDVADSFHQPQLVDVGFRALADLRSFHGVYQLGVHVTAAGHTSSCALGAIQVAGEG